MNVNTNKLTLEDKAKYRVALMRDPDKDFGAEFNRTTDLEISLIRQYGFQGIKLIFESQNSENYHLLGQLPDDSPWSSLNNKSMDAAIDTIFASIKGKVPRLVSTMKSRVRHIYAEQKGSQWRLHYLLDMKLYDGRDYFRIYTGGNPNSDAEPNKMLLKYDWTLPTELKAFYAIHDGFGANPDSIFVLSSEQLSVMAEMMNPIVVEQGVSPEGYLFEDLLEFFPDGAGNGQSFIRTKESNSFTVDWDHETWEISEPKGFFQFIDQRLSEIDEE